MRILLVARLVVERGDLDTIGIPEVAERRGHSVRVVASSELPDLLPDGGTPRYDVVICRYSGEPRVDDATSALAGAGVPVVGAGNGIWSGDDQIRTLRALRRAGVPTPDYVVVESLDEAEAALDALGKPVVTKDPATMGGGGVRLAADADEVRGHLAMVAGGGRLVVQRYYAESAGEDLRFFVVDSEVVGSIRRVARVGDFRANLALGGTAVPHRAAADEAVLAVAAASTIGLDIAGIDLLNTSDGPVVVEVNHNPGATGIALAAAKIVEYAERKASRRDGRRWRA